MNNYKLVIGLNFLKFLRKTQRNKSGPFLVKLKIVQSSRISINLIFFEENYFIKYTKEKITLSYNGVVQIQNRNRGKS